MNPVPKNVLATPLPQSFKDSAPRLQISNVVATFSLSNATLDARWFVQVLPGVSHDPEKFVVVKIRFREASMLVFTGGKVVCPGASSVLAACNHAEKLCQLLMSMGQIVACRNFFVQNIACTVRAPFEIDIKRISEAYSINITYTSEKFPALTFRFNDLSIICNVFMTGACVIAGAKTYEDACHCWTWLFHYVLVRFQKKNPKMLNSAQSRLLSLRTNSTVSRDANAMWTHHSGIVTEYSTCATPSTTVPNTPASASHWSETTAVQAFESGNYDGVLERMAMFTGHTATCLYVSCTDEGFFGQELCQLADALNECEFIGVLRPHLDCGCLSRAQLTKSDPAAIVRDLYAQIDAFCSYTQSRERTVTTEERVEDDFNPLYSFDTSIAAQLAAFRGDDIVVTNQCIEFSLVTPV